ncbi:MAG: hypothetical protein IPO58_11970 [Betaproteobacteria bacterium]|nr:hypothetical protein [Betaproteobacteria bacterium]MBK8742805.1 hypothetical protein [Betaproteobacteria bacterium]MBK9607084.1 hypothetical protein [Betaproteobacteria bacterium]
MTELARLTFEHFQPFVDQTFAVSAGGESLALRVTEVRLHPPPRQRTLSGKLVEANVARQPFSVFFRSEGEKGLRQGTYSAAPPDGGAKLMIFIVPLGFEEGGVVYEAVFN